jgi:hypothetical protein
MVSSHLEAEYQSVLLYSSSHLKFCKLIVYPVRSTYLTDPSRLDLTAQIIFGQV